MPSCPYQNRERSCWCQPVSLVRSSVVDIRSRRTRSPNHIRGRVDHFFRGVRALFRPLRPAGGERLVTRPALSTTAPHPYPSTRGRANPASTQPLSPPPRQQEYHGRLCTSEKCSSSSRGGHLVLRHRPHDSRRTPCYFARSIARRFTRSVGTALTSITAYNCRCIACSLCRSSTLTPPIMMITPTCLIGF